MNSIIAIRAMEGKMSHFGFVGNKQRCLLYINSSVECESNPSTLYFRCPFRSIREKIEKKDRITITGDDYGGRVRRHEPSSSLPPGVDGKQRN